MTSSRVLLITTDPLGERMPGPAIRAWHLAEVVSAEHQVTLVSSVACERRHPAMEVRFAEPDEVVRLALASDVVVGPGSVVRRYPEIAWSDIPLVIDIYDPYQLENLEPHGSADQQAHAANVAHLGAVVREDLSRGDFFLCASDRQRDFWLGSLDAVGRVNPDTYAGDPGLHRLIDVVPFGLPAVPPARRGPGLRTRLALGADDRVAVWGGGVYDWFDPLSLVRAVDQVRRTDPEIKLVFLGMRNPNPQIPEMRMASETRKLAGQLGLSGVHVLFNEGWVPYDERADFLLDADLGVSTHLDHLETRFSFRTRVLDYLWAGLPMLLTEGDSLADQVAGAGAGLTVPAADVDAIAAGLLRLLREPIPPESVLALADRFHWVDVAAPLLAFCRDPHPAADRTVGRGSDPRLVRSGTAMADALPIPPNASKGKEESSLSMTDARYVAQIRAAVARIGRRSGSDDAGVPAALADLADSATIDVEVPMGSNRRAGRAVKQVIKKLTRWYLRYVAQQTTVLGQASVRLGAALAEQADRLEDTTSGLATEMARLGERLERLERRLGETDDPSAAATELPHPAPERRG
jgi:glycosyltransferase involved in cell wall biosynthesis